MRLIKSFYEIIEQEPGLVGCLKHIEKAKRVCYKSEDNITEESYKKAVQGLVDLKHGAMLEHGTVYLVIPYEYIDMSEELDIPIVSDLVQKYINNKYSNTRLNDDGWSQLAFITTNYRVLVENNWLDDLQYLSNPLPFHEKRITVKFTCDRGVSHEYVRHRVFSFAQESTRYCNYSKDKFGNELTFIQPCWKPREDFYYEEGDGAIHMHPWGQNGENLDIAVGFIEENGTTDEQNFNGILNLIELTYFNLLKKGWTPQQARSVLPNSLKTELIMTGTIEQWKGFFELRCPGSAHPQARELAIPLQEEFINRGWI